MDSHDFHSFDWNSPRSSRIYDFPNSFEIGQNVQIVTDPIENEGPYLAGISRTANANQANIDSPMEDAPSMQPPSERPPENSTSRRAKYRNLDWEAHKGLIKQLYLDDDKTLTETMEIMKTAHSFEASHKLYKAKFKEWHWQKNLPSGTALYMMDKANSRKRAEGKETVFSFGGRVWEASRIESTLVRANKKARTDQFAGDVPTPQGVSYKTPKQAVDTPHYATIDEEEDEDEYASDEEVVGNLISDDDLSGSDADSDEHEGSFDNALVLTWQGHSRKDIQDMWDVARSHRDAGRHQEAEATLRQVLEGMNHVLGRTSEDTVQVAYQLADLYATTGQPEAAVGVVEELIGTHVQIWGYEHVKTQENTLKTVELLNAWGRHADALGLLSLSKELLQAGGSQRTSDSHPRRRYKGKGVQRRAIRPSTSDTAVIAQHALAGLTPPEIDRQLGVLRSRVAAKDGASQNLLAAIIAQCEGQTGLRLQELKAHGELVMLYHHLGQFEMNQSACNYALDSLQKAWDDFNWENDEIESFDFIEVVLQLAANVLKSHHVKEAERVFRQASDKATDTFGADDERTVWVLITVGIVYQTHLSWDDAEEWFEEAFAAARRSREWDSHDGVVKSLERALDNHHFSYISDRGRPFKTVFGVSGLKIMPGRLHLE